MPFFPLHIQGHIVLVYVLLHNPLQRYMPIDNKVDDEDEEEEEDEGSDDDSDDEFNMSLTLKLLMLGQLFEVISPNIIQ